jgi:hypothetical protein
MKTFRLLAIATTAALTLLPIALIGQVVPDNSPIGNVGAGTRLIVGDQPIIIPANEVIVYLQNGGVVVSWNGVDRRHPSCRLHVVSNPVVRELARGRTLTVTRSGVNGVGHGVYGDNLYFTGDITVDQLQCNRGTQGYMTVGELKVVLGHLFTLVEAAPVAG